MDDGLSRSSIERSDPHQWQTLEQYRIVHDQHLRWHPFIDPGKPDTLVFDTKEQNDLLRVSLTGNIYCNSEVTLLVEKWFETRTIGGLLQVRGRIYRYIGYIPGDAWVLKYHNLHEDQDEYIHRVRDPATGRVQSETLARSQFPVMSEVLDELEVLAARFSS